MNNLAYNENGAELATYETPFADSRSEFTETHEQQFEEGFSISEFETPFSQSFEFSQEKTQNPLSNDYVSLLAELNDHEFENSVYELVAEFEDSFSNESPIANETFSGYTQNQVQEYFQPLVNETHKMLDQAEAKFSGNNLGDINEAEVEHFFNEWEINRGDVSLAQEGFLGRLARKVKSVVKSGINLAKKGISFVGSKILGPLLAKLKKIIWPLLRRVLKYAAGKIPLALRPYAVTLAKKFLNIDISETSAYENSYEFSNESYEYDREADHEADHEFEMSATGNISEIQTELDHQIANLVFAETEAEAETMISNYTNVGESYESYNGETYETMSESENSVDVARQNFINELQNLQPGQSLVPAIEKFLPVLAIKGVISVIGRKRVINFLAGLLANLVSKWVPKEVSKPLAASIIDVGARVFGFETNEAEKSDLAYEAIANTIQETVQNLTSINETLASDKETATAQVLEAFEIAVANNFPAQYIKAGLRPSMSNGLWILKPIKSAKPSHKTYSNIFHTTLTPQMTRNVRVWRGLPLANFLRDKLGIETQQTSIQARVHLFEAIRGTTLSKINRFEKIYGLNGSPHGWKLILPATKHALSVLINEPGLGRNFSRKYLHSHTRIAIGQRFYYLEIPGSRIRFNPCTCPRHLPSLEAGIALSRRSYSVAGIKSSPGKHAQSSDVQVILNFIKSEIRLNYYFSEEDSKSIVEKLNRNDFIGAAMGIRNSLRNVLHGILLRNIGNKVKIIHETMPELYLENMENENQQEALGGVVLNAGRALLGKIVDKLVNRLVNVALNGVVNYFKARAAEFKQAQSTLHDGVTMKIIWLNVSGMTGIRAVINAIRGKMSIGNLADLALPNIPAPEIVIQPGKKFE
jgi:hypothetical protein